MENLTLVGTGNLSGTGNGLANVITGNDGDNQLSGLGGDDTLLGKGGADRLDGGAGKDAMTGNGGDDVYVVDDPGDTVNEIPGGGTDTVEASVAFALPPDVERLVLRPGAASGTGNELANEILGTAAAETISGLAGDDRIEGGGGADVLDGGEGLDTLSFAGATAGVVADLRSGKAGEASFTGFEALVGSSLADRLSGGNGADALLGGDGNDRLEGRGGRDSLTGGAGADSFVFRRAADSRANRPDTVTDLSTGDRIDLSAFDAVPATKGRQRFAWRGAKRFTGKAGELRFAAGKLQADLDGDRKADFAVRLPGVKTLANSALRLK